MCVVFFFAAVVLFSCKDNSSTALPDDSSYKDRIIFGDITFNADSSYSIISDTNEFNYGATHKIWIEVKSPVPGDTLCIRIFEYDSSSKVTLVVHYDEFGLSVYHLYTVRQFRASHAGKYSTQIVRKKDNLVLIQRDLYYR